MQNGNALETAARGIPISPRRVAARAHLSIYPYPSTAGARSARLPTRHSAHRAPAHVDVRRAVARSGPAVRGLEGKRKRLRLFSLSSPERRKARKPSSRSERPAIEGDE